MGDRRPAVSDRIHQAMEFAGDPVDNAEYQDAKDEQGFVEGRIRELEQVLATATIRSADSAQDGVVTVGCTVTVQDEDGEQEKFTLVGSTEASPFEGRFSLDSPLGRAVMGHSVGETVVVNAPAGEIKYAIVSSVPRV